MTLVPIDASNEASVITLLERAAQWLAEAVHRGEPGEVAAVKAQLATAAEATKQLGLSKDIQLDAQEMVRRAEYALGKAIRRGQAEGTVETEMEAKRRAGLERQHGVGYADLTKPRSRDFATHSELSNSQGGIYDLADNADPETFDAALEAAKAEGNLSRANVIRKVKGQPNFSKSAVTRDMRAEMIRNLAEQGYASRQMPEQVGVTENTIREIARDFDIEIPADRVLRGSRRLDHTQMVENHVTALENSVEALKYIDFAEVDFSEADDWVASLNQSISKLRKFANRIKETTRV